jgi:sugar phosphate permease
VGYRWVILAVGTAGQASYAALLVGLSILAPALQDRYELSLTAVGVVLATVSVGAMLTQLPWGFLADRVGERLVMAVGLCGAAAATAAASSAGGFWPLCGLLFLAGASGAGVNAAGGRAVMHWFPAARRGTALGIRQTAVPIGGLLAALVLPHLGLSEALLALAGALLVTGLAAAALIREGGAVEELSGGRALGPLRDGRMWRLASGSALLVTAQVCIPGFTVLFLHEQHGVSAVSAAAVVALVQVFGIASRIGAGWWSDVVGSRIGPLRLLSLALAVAAELTAAVAVSPLALLVPVLVVAGTLSMSWNGLSFTAAAEIAGHARSGAALGFQQTALSVAAAVAAPVFAALVSALSWRAGFGLLAIAPLSAWVVLGRLVSRETILE